MKGFGGMKLSRKSISEILSVMLCAMLLVAGFGDGSINHSSSAEEETARELTSSCSISYGAEKTVISSDEIIGGIYIEWKNIPGEWTLEVKGNDGVRSVGCGADRFYHEYVTVGGSEATVSFKNFKDKIRAFRIFGKGTLPDDVQVWEKPCETADIVLFSTHSDDEHLFFAGILPYYAGELSMNVQVVYMVDHAKDSADRPHELLNGLWNVGVRNYPVIGEPPDLYAENLDSAYATFNNAGYSKEYFTEFVTENLRRFKPLVAIGHDFQGEYGHGAHMVYAKALSEAVALSNDGSYHSKSYEKYGGWEVPKVYLHLYKENEIVMDWDSKILDSFGGRSAFQVSIEEGFSRHESQHYTWFSKWCGFKSDWGVKSAADIEKLSSKNLYLIKDGGLSPRRFGLYSSTVGEDVAKNDFFENIDKASLRGETATEKPTEIPAENPTEEPVEKPTAAPSDTSVEELPTLSPTGAPTGGLAENTESALPNSSGTPEKNSETILMVVLCSVAVLLVTVFVLLWFKWQKE